MIPLRPLPALAALLALATPAMAEDMPDLLPELTMQVGDSDPELRYAGALALCYLQWGDYDGQRQFLEDMGWTHATWGGLNEYTSGTAQILMSQDFFCVVSDTQIDQPTAQSLLLRVMDAGGHVAWTDGTDEQGCRAQSGPLGRIVVSSAGQDPVCTPTGNSAVRFWIAPDTN